MYSLNWEYKNVLLDLGVQKCTHKFFRMYYKLSNTCLYHEDGTESAINALHSTNVTNEDQPPPEVIGDMLRFILTHNVTSKSKTSLSRK